MFEVFFRLAFKTRQDEGCNNRKNGTSPGDTPFLSLPDLARSDHMSD